MPQVLLALTLGVASLQAAPPQSAAPAPAAQEATGRIIQLELRIFDGSDDVTADTRVTVYKAGDRTRPIAQPAARDGRIELPVEAGFYDAQAIRERDGRVLTIRWAERLVVMPYPDEDGRHLEVVNLRSGYGALQVRVKAEGPLPPIAIHAAGAHDKPAAPGVDGSGYRLFVVPAGRYDVQVGAGNKAAWHTAIDVPLDRTRLWIVP